MNWLEWKSKYKEQIKHVAGYEEQFVDTVLSNIPEITPEDVIPQFHFIDSKGGNRFIDFMIINKSKNYCLPIELDGYTKMVGNGNQYYKFNDFLERQNSIIAQFGLVLRYSNNKMRDEAAHIIAEIKDSLNRQQQHQSVEQTREKHIKSLQSDYRLKFDDVQQRLSLLENIPKTSSNKMLYGILGLILLSILGLGFIILNKNNDSNRVIVQAPNPSMPPANNNTTNIPVTKPETIKQPNPINNEVCDTVDNIKKFSKGVYLNLGGIFPNHKVNVVIWNGDINTANSYLYKYVCVSGKTTEYKGKPQIEVNSFEAIHIQ